MDLRTSHLDTRGSVVGPAGGLATGSAVCQSAGLSAKPNIILQSPVVSEHQVLLFHCDNYST